MIAARAEVRVEAGEKRVYDTHGSYRRRPRQVVWDKEAQAEKGNTIAACDSDFFDVWHLQFDGTSKLYNLLQACVSGL
jgi:hypothetical protein